jgi:hypothetical protein
MANPPYFPAKNSDQFTWLLNFATLLTDTPLVFGLVSGDAVLVQAAVDAYEASYNAWSEPTTRTQVLTAAKDAALANAKAVVFRYAVRISQNPAVTAENKTAIGVTVRSTTRQPVPDPTAVPVITVQGSVAGNVTFSATNSERPGKRGAPYGCSGFDLWYSIGTLPATDPAQLQYYGRVTKTPRAIAFGAQNSGKVLSFAGRYSLRNGRGGVQVSGPWSAMQSTVIG